MSAFDDLPPDPQVDVSPRSMPRRKRRMALLPNCGVSPRAWVTLPDRSWQGRDGKVRWTKVIECTDRGLMQRIESAALKAWEARR